MTATREKPLQRTFTESEAQKAFRDILALVASAVTVRIVRDGREVCVMESPIDRADRQFRELREREAAEENVPARLTRPQFFKD